MPGLPTGKRIRQEWATAMRLLVAHRAGDPRRIGATEDHHSPVAGRAPVDGPAIDDGRHFQADSHPDAVGLYLAGVGGGYGHGRSVPRGLWHSKIRAAADPPAPAASPLRFGVLP